MRLSQGVLLFVHNLEHKPLESYEILETPEFAYPDEETGEPIYTIRVKFRFKYD